MHMGGAGQVTLKVTLKRLGRRRRDISGARLTPFPFPVDPPPSCSVGGNKVLYLTSDETGP